MAIWNWNILNNYKFQIFVNKIIIILIINKIRRNNNQKYRKVISSLLYIRYLLEYRREY